MLCTALALWTTDDRHGVAPGWISTAAALVCLLPGVNLVPHESLRRDLSFAMLIYVAGILGGTRFRETMRVLLPLLLVSEVILIPLSYLWWGLMGYLN